MCVLLSWCLWVCAGVVIFPRSDAVDDCEGGGGVSPLCTFEKADERSYKGVSFTVYFPDPVSFDSSSQEDFLSGVT